MSDFSAEMRARLL